MGSAKGGAGQRTMGLNLFRIKMDKHLNNRFMSFPGLPQTWEFAGPYLIYYRAFHMFEKGNQKHQNPRPIERPLESVFHKTDMKIWAGQNFLAGHNEFKKGQHVLS